METVSQVLKGHGKLMLSKYFLLSRSEVWKQIDDPNGADFRCSRDDSLVLSLFIITSYRDDYSFLDLIFEKFIMMVCLRRRYLIGFRTIL